MAKCKITFIGGGHMARALVRGLVNAGYDSSCIMVTSRSQEKLVYFQRELAVKVSLDNSEAVKFADIVFLCVKPQQMSALCSELKGCVSKRQLVVSIAAGLSLSQVGEWLPQAAIVRLMPNLAVSIGQGVVGVCVGEHGLLVNDMDFFQIISLWGEVMPLENESQLAALTVISASGVAFYCCLSEILQKAAIDYNMPLNMVERLVLQTASGAAALVEENDTAWADVRVQVTSPGGTTAAALDYMTAKGVHGAVREAIDLAVGKAININKKD
jgi:pyrroline-5-carboxylate reductase